MKKKLLMALVALSALSNAQTTLMSSTVNNGGFESGDTGWNIVNGTTTNAWRISTGATAGFSGSNSIYVSNSTAAPFAHAYDTGTTTVVHFYKDITFPAGETNVNLSFDYIVQGEGTSTLYDYLRVYLVPTTFTPTANSLPSTSTYPNYWTFNLKGNSWQNATINLPASALGNATAATTHRLLFVWANDSSLGTQPPAAIDNITVVSSSLSCPTITSPAANAGNLSLTPTISWNAVPGATSYKISVGTTSGGTNILNNVDLGTATSYTFAANALNPTTQYFYTVSSFSGNSSSGACLVNNFTTGCTVLNAPYVQNFDSGVLPGCWVRENPTYTGTSSYINWLFSGNPDYGTTNNGRTAGTFAWVDASSPYSGVHDVNLISPSINLTGLTTPTVSFEWFKNHLNGTAGTLPSYDNNKLTLAINDGAGWVDMWTSATNAANWRDVEIELPASYLNKTIQARFTVDKDVAGNGYFYDNVLLDNFKVDNKATCPKPTNLSLGTSTGTNMTVNWTAPSPAPASGYEVYYSSSSVAPTSQTVPTLTGITTTSASIPGSDTVRTYVWVRSVCSTTSKSDWSNSVNFILPPSNDTCANAIQLTVGPNFDAYPLIGNLNGASTDVQPSCASNLADNVWYKFVVPASGSVTVQTKEIVGSDLDDTLIAVYSGACGTLTEINCNDDDSNSLFSEIQLTGQTPGATLYLHVQKYSNSTDDGTFRVAAYDASVLATQEIGATKKLNIYPNPFKDIINITNAENYDKAIVADMSGRVVKSFDKVTPQINLDDLATGIYVLNLESKDGTKSSVKVVKK